MIHPRFEWKLLVQVIIGIVGNGFGVVLDHEAEKRGLGIPQLMLMIVLEQDGQLGQLDEPGRRDQVK